MKNNAVMFKGMRTILCATILVFLLGSCKKEVFDPASTQEFALQSSANGATYHIKVGLPANYNPEVEKYSSIYVLDGEEIFDFVSNECKEISDERNVKNAIVISIGYGKNRSIDYTPTAISSSTGGGSQFLNFIKTQ